MDGRAGSGARKKERVKVMSCPEGDLPQADFLGRALMDEVKDYAIYLLDRSGHVLSWNRGAELLKGYTEDEIKGVHFSVFYTPEDRAAGKPDSELAAAAREGRFEEEGWRVRKDGSRFWGNEIVTALHDSSGKVCGFAKIERDLSRRKGMEDALREGEERLRLLIENARDYAIFMIGPDGRIQTWNAGAQRIFGYNEAEIIGKPGAILFTPEDQAAGEHEKELTRALAHGRASDDRWQMRKGSERFWASGVTAPIRSFGGTLRGFAKVCRDLTESKRHEEQREQLLHREQQARLEAERAMTLRDEFLAIVSHELRTPLGAILLWTRLLSQRVNGDEEAVEAINVIEQSALSQKQLVDDLLDVSSMVTGKLRLNRRETDLAAVIRAAIDVVQPMADGKGVTLEVLLDEQAGNVLADPDRLQQVIWNVLNNAVKFTPRGGSATVRLARSNGLVRVFVTDTGIGISREFLPHVFEPFRQADASTTRTHAGLGLGLAICRQLVTLHGGTIRAESAGEGQGATFTIELPVTTGRKSTPDEPSGRAGSDTAGVPVILRGVHVLLVEDEPHTREAVRRLLELSGAQVTAVESAAAGMAALDALSDGSRPDVLVTDIGMPEQDGYSLLAEVRAWEARNGIAAPVPALALTAYAREADQRLALDAGFQAHVGKPVEPETLVNSVAALAGRGGS